MFYFHNISSDFISIEIIAIFTPHTSLRVTSGVNITPLMSVKFTLPRGVHF